MGDGAFIPLVSNVSLLLAMVFTYDLFTAHSLNFNSWLRQIIIGIGLGAITQCIMLVPWQLEPGIFFDTRSVLISVCGLFFGLVPTVIAVIMAAVLRIIQGGSGMVTGVSVIVASGVIGLLWRRWSKRPLKDLSWRSLLAMAYAVHFVMLALMLLLPRQIVFDVLSRIALPVLIIYPLGTLAVGLLLLNRLQYNTAAAAVRESEVQFRALSEQAAIGVTKTEVKSGRYVWVNQRFADIVGYTREELLNMTFQSLTDPDDLAGDERNLDLLVKGQIYEYSMEKRYCRKDGGSVWVQLTVSPLWRPGEEPGFLIGLIEDISERKQAEEAERKLAAILGKSLNEIYVLDPVTFRFLYVNEAVLRNLGYTLDEIRGMDATVFRPELSDERLREMAHPLFDGTRQLLILETILRRKDGTEYPVEAHLQLIGEGSQRVFLAVVNDITERRRAKAELEASHQVLLEAQAIAHVGDWQLDPSTLLFTWSNEAYAIHGITPGTPVSHDAYRLLIHPDDQKRVLATMRDAVRGTNREFSLEYHILRSDDSERTIFMTGKTTMDANRRVNSIRGIMQDITERKRAEMEKQAIQLQLLQGQKMEAIGELAGGVAHDFNNLLTGILGNITIVRDALPRSDPLQENVNQVDSAARHAAELTRGMLTFARSAVVMPSPVRINDAVESALAILRQSLPSTIEIACDFEESAWNVLFDQTQMTQIILNLGINARDAMGGKGRITFVTRNVLVDEYYVRQYPFAQTGEYVLLNVTDSGPGISPEAMHHIFEPFYTTKPAGSGTGLGLPIVYGAVKQAGGWITANSPPGAGATFKIYLPRTFQQPGVTVEAAATEVVQAAGRGGTILVVEDELAVASVTRNLLTRQGYSVVVAAEGAQAVAAIQAESPHIDLILLDMTMPGMTTEETVNSIRHLDHSVPILLNSGFTSGETVASLLENGTVQGFLSKPYDLTQLFGSINRILTSRRENPV